MLALSYLVGEFMEFGHGAVGCVVDGSTRRVAVEVNHVIPVHGASVAVRHDTRLGSALRCSHTDSAKTRCIKSFDLYSI